MENYGLQSVIIKKSVNPDDAVKMARDIIKKKDFKKRELKNTYHFRAIAKTKFIPTTFRSKKINKDITLRFGELKPEFHRLSGSGFLDYFRKGYEYVKDKVVQGAEKVKEFFSPRLDDYNNKTKSMLKTYGNNPITKMTIYRNPVSKYIPVVLNLVSLGKWNAAVKKAGYDKFFHLSLIVECGATLNIEKLDVVSISKDIPEGDAVETKDVPLQGKSFTLGQLMEKARSEAGDKAFFEYDAFKNNCQSFVSYLLKGQGLYGDEEMGFTYQPIQEVIDEMPDYVKRFQKGVTDISATFNKITGQGKNREQALKDQLHMHFGSRVKKQYMPQISAYKSGFLAGWDAERQQAPSEFKDNLVEVWARAYDDGREAKERYEEDTEEDIINMDTRGSGRPQIPMPYSSSEGMYQIGFGRCVGCGSPSIDEQIESYRQMAIGSSMATRSHANEMIRRLEEQKRMQGVAEQNLKFLGMGKDDGMVNLDAQTSVQELRKEDQAKARMDVREIGGSLQSKSKLSGGNELQLFADFLKQKGVNKKPSDSKLKQLYREFKGVKRIQGSGFWDDFKRGFNMVFEPGAKYILKPLLATTGPYGLAGVAGLTALGYGKEDKQLKQDTTLFALAEDLYKKVPKEQVKSGLERFASAGLNHFFPKSGRGLHGAGFFDDIKNFFVKTIPAVGQSYAQQMTDATKQIKRAVGLGKKDIMYVKEGLRKLGSAIPNDMYEERENELDTIIGSGMSGSGLWDAIKEFVNRHAFNLLRKVNPIFAMLPEAQYRGGGSRGANYMRAMMGAMSENPEVKKRWLIQQMPKEQLMVLAREQNIPQEKLVFRGENGKNKYITKGKLVKLLDINEIELSDEGEILAKEKGQKINASKFRDIGEKGFKLETLSKTTQSLAKKSRKAIKGDRNEKKLTKEFHKWIKRNAPLFEPQAKVDGVNYRGTYDLEGLFDRFMQERNPIEEEGMFEVPVVEVEEKEEKEEKQPENQLVAMAERYNAEPVAKNKKAIKKQMKDAGYSDAEITRVLARYRKRKQYRKEGRKERK